MARKPPLFPQTMIYIAITVALIASVVGYILRYQESNDSDPVYALDLSPSSPALQQKVTDTLTQKMNEDTKTNDDDLEFSGHQQSMEIKLSALIRASTENIDPTDKQLDKFFTNHSQHYTSDAQIEFLYRRFNTADHGGNTAQIARSMLTEMKLKDAPLKNNAGVGEDGYSFDFYTQIDERFGEGFSDKLIDIIKPNLVNLPCWDGPISGKNGVYLICVKSYQSGTLPNLSDIKERVINDWRLSLANQP